MMEKKNTIIRLPKRAFILKFTPQGKRYALLILAVAVAALNTGNNLLYLIVSMMLSTIAFSWLTAKFYNKKLHISLQMPEDVYAMKQFLMRINIKNNKKWLPTSPQLLQFYREMELSSPPFIPQLKPGATVQCKISHSFKRRGIYQIKNLKAHSTYPLGIFLHRHQLSLEEKEIIVYPQIKPLKEFYLNGSLGHKALESFIRGGSFSLYNIRDYIAGDEARFLHWKASAKLSKLMVKEFLQEEQRKVSILLDTSFPEKLDEYKREDFEEKVSLAASLIFYFISHDYSVRLVTSDKEIPFGWGTLHLHKMLRHLALIEADYREKPDLVELSLGEPEVPNSCIILISYRSKESLLFYGRHIWHISKVEALA